MLHEKATCNGKPIPREAYAYTEFFGEHLGHDEEVVSVSTHFACDDRLSPHHSGFRITVTPKTGRSFEYSLKLQRDDYGPHPKCWLIKELNRVTHPDKPAPPAAVPAGARSAQESTPDTSAQPAGP